MDVESGAMTGESKAKILGHPIHQMFTVSGRPVGDGQAMAKARR